MDTAKPVLFISGADDPVGGTKGVTAAYKTFKKAGVSDLTLKLCPGLRHEVLNERENAEIYAYILNWLEERMGVGVLGLLVQQSQRAKSVSCGGAASPSNPRLSRLAKCAPCTKALK